MDKFPELFSKNASAPVFRSRASPDPINNPITDPNSQRLPKISNIPKKDSATPQNTLKESYEGGKGIYQDSKAKDNVPVQDCNEEA